MMPNPLNLVQSLLAHRLTRQVRELWTSTLILDLAVSMVTIFEPVFLFVLFSRYYDLKSTLELISLFYLAIYVAYFFVVPLGAKFAKRFGYENSIAAASLFQIGIYFSLFAANHSLLFVYFAIIAYVIAKMLYWPAFHSNFARFSTDGEQGREISNLWALESFVYVIGPVLGGLVIEFFGFRVLFIIVSVLILVSSIPMIVTKETFDAQSFPYWSSIKRLFTRENRKHFLAELGYGEEWIYLVIWPIFMYLIAENYLGLGLISATSTFLATLLLLFIGRLADKSDKQIVLRLGVIFYFFGWLLKIMARTPVGVLILDTYSRVAKNSISLPVVASTYRDAQKSSVMNTIVFFEMSLVIGKILAIILCLVLLQLFSPGWNSFFILGGIFTLFYLFFKLK